jgi:hypothetical protein
MYATSDTKLGVVSRAVIEDEIGFTSENVSQCSMRRKESRIALPANELPENLARKVPYERLVGLDGDGHPKYSGSRKWTEAANNYLPRQPGSPRPESNPLPVTVQSMHFANLIES